MTTITQDPIEFAKGAMLLCNQNYERAVHAVSITINLDPDFRKAVERELFEINVKNKYSNGNN